MDLIFTADQLIKRHKGITYDDVLLVPNYSGLTSRKDPVLASKLTKDIDIEMPLVSANMDTVTEASMAMAMSEVGGVGIIHRFMDVDKQITEIEKLKAYREEKMGHFPIAASIGVKLEGIRRGEKLIEAGAQILTIDIAHGDSELMIETLDHMKKNYPNIQIIAGNVATADGTKRLCDHGADCIKVGIGPGSMCTTRLIAGCGVPQLTALALCAQVGKEYEVPIMADGGVRYSGDLVKAFAAGASTVMLGSLFAGCLETPGELKGGKKKYRGMASKDAQVSWRGKMVPGMAAEGVDTWIPCKGQANDVILELTGGLRSGMTYLNASTIAEIPERASFIEVTTAGVNESRPHGLQ